MDQQKQFRELFKRVPKSELDATQKMTATPRVTTPRRSKENTESGSNVGPGGPPVLAFIGSAGQTVFRFNQRRDLCKEPE